MKKSPAKKRIAAKSGRAPKPKASRSRGKAIHKNLPAEDQKQAADDIRRAIDDGMQDLRMSRG